ncbi:MAG: PTS sugar transporter subunit IIA [Chlamydiae bacterium]|nr:PTS sugar transporter subunit IIA [Chlamydiota bacterium]
MSLAEILPEVPIVPEAVVFFEKSTQSEILDALFNSVEDSLGLLNLQEIKQKILEREEVSSTCIGAQIAIPHAKVEGLDRFIMALGIHREGVEWGESDTDGVHLILLILGPVVDPIYYLNYLSSLTRRLKNHKLKEKLLGSNSAQEAFEIFNSEDKSWI